MNERAPAGVERWVVVGLTLALAICCVLTVTAWAQEEWFHFVDGAIYILTAQSLGAGEGYTYLDKPFFVRPPGLSALLVPFVGEPLDFGVLNLLIQALAALSVVAVALAMSRLLGAARGLTVALLYALSPLTAGAFNRIFSEFPFVVLFFTGAWLLLPARDGRPASTARAIGGALCLAASLYFRSVALLALPFLALMRTGSGTTPRAGSRKLSAVLAVGVLLLYVPWIAFTRAAAAEAEKPSTQLLMFDYSTALFHVDSRDPDSAYVDLDGWLQRLENNSERMVTNLDQVLAGLDGSPAPLALALVTLAAMLFTTWRRRSFLHGYMLAYLGVMLLYFTFIDRLLLPLLPLVFAALLDGVEQAGDALGRKLGAQRLGVTLMSVVAGAVLVTSFTSHEASRTQPWQRQNWARQDEAAAQWVRENTAPDDRILYSRSSILAVLSGRRVYTHAHMRHRWPKGYPEVDFAVFGPITARRIEPEPTIKEAAGEMVEIPIDWISPRGNRWVKEVFYVRAYDVRDVAQGER